MTDRSSPAGHARVDKLKALVKALPRSLQKGEPSGFFENWLRNGVPDPDVEAFIRSAPPLLLDLLAVLPPVEPPQSDLLEACRAVLGCDERTDCLAGNEHIRDLLRGAIAKASTLSPSDAGWRDIATAKAGEKMLVGWFGYPLVLRAELDRDGIWVQASNGATLSRPDKWQPLPAPPGGLTSLTTETGT